MKKLIFDLDGTLWETGESYIYSYNKACEQLNIPLEKRQGPEFVLSYLGIKLEELVQTIIPEAPNKYQLGMMLLGGAIEYLVKNPKTYSKNIFDLFSTLSLKYEIYIISNCPRPFLEAFYTVSGIKQFVTGDNTIEDSEKTEIIKKISGNYEEETLFVGDAPSDYEAIGNHQSVKFVYGAYGYKDCETYDYYLKNIDELPELLTEIEEISQILKNEKYEVICNNGSSAVLMQKKDCYYFGFLKVKNLRDFEKVIDRLKEKTSGKVLYGPINNNSWYSYRIALNEFDFKLYPDCYGDEALVKLFLEKGFDFAEKYASTLTRLNLKVLNGDRAVSLSSDYECKVVKGMECADYLKSIFEISCHCFSDHDFYEPIDFETFKKLYLGILSSCSPVLILIFYKGDIAGFNFGYCDPENRFFVDKTFAIEKKHRTPGILYKIIQMTTKEIQQLGFEELLFHFQNQKLKTMQSYFKGLIIRQKEYGVLRYEGHK